MALFEHIDDEFNFGKFKGLSLSDVMDICPHYIVWCMFNVTYSPFIITDEAMKELSIIYPQFKFGYEFEVRRLEVIKQWESKKNQEDNNIVYFYDEVDTYNEYNGSYAQDYMDYSDDEIDIIFDGNPDAYWNID